MPLPARAIVDIYRATQQHRFHTKPMPFIFIYSTITPYIRIVTTNSIFHCSFCLFQCAANTNEVSALKYDENRHLTVHFHTCVSSFTDKVANFSFSVSVHLQGNEKSSYQSIFF
jgi:hypothetical protein